MRSETNQMKKMNKKGFTLAELLIVVAIIAVLVAIAIPVFSTQLDKARAATDLANIRSGYAAAVSGFLTGDYGKDDVVYLNVDGTVSETSGTYECKGNADDADNDAAIGSFDANGIGWEKGNPITYTFDDNGVSAIGHTA